MDWEELDEFLMKEFEFENYVKAIEFVNKITPVAEKMNHHPHILIHSYNKVQVMLKSHDEGEITDKDYKLAEEIDKL